ncbi:hypothetical protein BTO30_02930 [Domibacillus antri]|uniref:Uncharacterized protein n=1 Tax=Domibacillus antri TaxID=1714264 RepID=A0A1Q8Q8N6_9BACI|nr:hypothetical protein BTO30_02930 [Domibacillus antri]
MIMDNATIEADFQYHRKENQRIDRRINELGMRCRPELYSEEMLELLLRRRHVKAECLRLRAMRRR